MSSEPFSLPVSTDDPVVMHDEFQQIVLDALGSCQAVNLLMVLLQADPEDELPIGGRGGLAVLLGSVHQRLELVLDGLGATALALGMDDIGELARGS